MICTSDLCIQNSHLDRFGHHVGFEMRNAARPIIVLEVMPQQYVVVLIVHQYSAMPIVVGRDIR